MRVSAFLGSALAAISASASAVTMNINDIKDAFVGSPAFVKTRQPRSRGGKPPFRYRTGVTYPHSSERQRARYARQIAAGQIKLETA